MILTHPWSLPLTPRPPARCHVIPQMNGSVLKRHARGTVSRPSNKSSSAPRYGKHLTSQPSKLFPYQNAPCPLRHDVAILLGRTLPQRRLTTTSWSRARVAAT